MLKALHQERRRTLCRVTEERQCLQRTSAGTSAWCRPSSTPALVHRVSPCAWAGDETREGLWSAGKEGVEELAGEAAATEVGVYAELDHREKRA